MIRRTLTAAVAALTLVAMSVAPAAADTTRDQQWYLADQDITQVHQITRGSGAVVALIDTGVDAEHRDLAGALLPGLDAAGSRWSGNTAGHKDLDGHGTNMAGIIAGRGHGSGDGVLGIAPAVKVLPISAPTDSYASSSFMTEAVDFAIAQHAGVINMSFGRPDDDTMHDAIRKAQAAGIVLVAASGNQGAKEGNYPGEYPEVLTVGAYGKDGKIASFSVTGPQVDLTAPGDQILTTGIEGAGYNLSSGTSEAAALVSGAAALVRAEYPTMSAAEVVHRLTATADDAGAAGRDDTYGYGRLNILEALTADVEPLPATSASSAAVGAAPAATSALDTSDLPAAASPLLLAGILAAVVLVIAAIAVIIVLRRRRSLDDG